MLLLLNFAEMAFEKWPPEFSSTFQSLTQSFWQRYGHLVKILIVSSPTPPVKKD